MSSHVAHAGPGDKEDEKLLKSSTVYNIILMCIEANLMLYSDILLTYCLPRKQRFQNIVTSLHAQDKYLYRHFLPKFQM